MRLFHLVALLALSAGGVSAQSGDPQAGEQLAGTCSACHGQDGNSLNGEWPKVAGQHESYLVRQLKLYRNGGRPNDIMMSFAAPLSDQDILDLAAFYARQTVQAGVADDQLATEGERLYRGGDVARGIPACAACHGPSGRGNPGSAYPALAGQHADYTAAQLRAFHAGAVWGEGEEANAVMAGVARMLTDREIEALATYIEGIYDRGALSRRR